MTGRWRSRSTTRVSRQGPVKPSMWSRCAGFVLRTGFCRPRSRRSLLGNSRSLTSRHDSGSRRVPCIIGSLKASSRLGAILAGAGACRSPRTLRRRVVNGCSLRCTSNSQPKRALWEVQFEVTVPDVVDRWVQQAAHRVLSPHWEPTFHPSSHGFRPGRSCHTAIAEAKTYLADGYEWVVDLDLEKFFDRVHHQRLIARLETKIGDRRLITLIQRMLKAKVVMPEGVVVNTDEGVPQGGPLTPRTQKVTSVDAWIIRANRRRIVTVRRGRGHRDAVTDHDRVIADEYLLDEQPHEA